MLFARWQHRIRFGSGFPYESNVNENFKVIQNPGFLPDHPKIESLVVFAIPDIP